MADLRIIYSTFPNEKEAQKVADKLVDSKLAACVVVVPGLSSTYVWKGKRSKDKEVIMLVKTHKKTASKVMKKLESLHPYDCPCVIMFKAADVNKAYLLWASKV